MPIGDERSSTNWTSLLVRMLYEDLPRVYVLFSYPASYYPVILYFLRYSAIAMWIL